MISQEKKRETNRPAEHTPMRGIALLLLMALAVCAHADGMTLSSSADRLQESGQAAIINLDGQGATLDMYIAIDGIPAGSAITYVLPFWHKPEDFRLEMMDGKQFAELYLKPARKQMGSFVDRSVIKDAAFTSFACGSSFAGPLTWAILAGKVFFPVFSSKLALLPYQTATVPGAKAELYHVPEKDLPALVRKAGLPEKYAKQLLRYNTEYFAVMHLTGMKLPEPKENTPIYLHGVHYHFRHPMHSPDQYTYTYPLGTGGGWPQPILLTDIFVLAPKGYAVNVHAPKYGTKSWYHLLMGLEHTSIFHELLESPDVAAENIKYYSKDPDSMFSPKTASLTPDHWNAPVWHRAYWCTNPTEDIIITLEKRKDFAAYRAIDVLANPITFTLLALLGFVFAWWVAINKHLRERLAALGLSERLPFHSLRLLRHATGYGVIGTLLLFDTNLYLAVTLSAALAIWWVLLTWRYLRIPADEHKAALAEKDPFKSIVWIAFGLYAGWVGVLLGLAILTNRYLLG